MFWESNLRSEAKVEREAFLELYGTFTPAERTKNKEALTHMHAVAAALFMGGCATTEPAFVSDGLVAYYPFNGNAKDESGNGNDGEIVGKINFSNDRHEMPNNAGLFEGGFTFVESPNGLSPTNTISCWININEIGRDQYPIDLGRANNNWIEIRGSGAVVIGGHGQTKWTRSKTLLESGRWYFLTKTSDDNKLSFFINGKLDHADEVPPRTSSSITIGNIGPGHPRNYPFYGRIDDVRIYNRALSAAEVKALYDLEKPKGK